MPDSTSEDAMADFILAGGKNFYTALLVYNAFPRAAEKLISAFAWDIERALAEEPGWKVVRNTLASSPTEQFVELTWAPIEWEEFGWGISLSPQRGNARDFIFGIFAVTAGNKDADYLRDPGKYPAMSDADRTRLGDAIAPLLNSTGDRDRVSPWWSRYTYLRTIKNWTDPTVLMKIACANGVSAERDLVSGKPMDEFVIDLFRAAKAAMTEVHGLRDIRPHSS